jgi:hypothetical protein
MLLLLLAALFVFLVFVFLLFLLGHADLHQRKLLLLLLKVVVPAAHRPSSKVLQPLFQR